MHMKKECSLKYNNECVNDIYKRLFWYTFDIVTNQYKVTDDDRSVYHKHLTEYEYYDIILDKGTLDAILVEGSATDMLNNVYNRLKVNGVYLICSLSSAEMMSPLLENPNYYYEVVCMEHSNTNSHSSVTNPNTEMTGTIIQCTKTRHIGLQVSTMSPPLNSEDPVNNDLTSKKLHEIRQYEKHVMDKYFQCDHSLVTEKLKLKLYDVFYGGNPLDNDSIPLSDAYSLLFGSDVNADGDTKDGHAVDDMQRLSVDYTYPLFLEDIGNYIDMMRGESELHILDETPSSSKSNASEFEAADKNCEIGNEEELSREVEVEVNVTSDTNALEDELVQDVESNRVDATKALNSDFCLNELEIQYARDSLSLLEKGYMTYAEAIRFLSLMQ